MEAALQACNEMRRRDNDPTLPKTGMTTSSESTANTASPASVPLKVLPSIDSISSIQSQGQSSSVGTTGCLDGQAKKVDGTRRYVDDRATPPLYPAQTQGGLYHPIPPRSAGGSSGVSSSEATRRTVQSVEQELMREADQRLDRNQQKDLPVAAQLSQVKTQAMLDQHQKEWEQKSKELDQTKREIQDQARALERAFEELRKE